MYNTVVYVVRYTMYCVCYRSILLYVHTSLLLEIHELIICPLISYVSQTPLPIYQGEDEGTRHRSRDDYDRTVRELAFEKRGIPTDRLKTDEEAAKEEKERLEKLEVSF